MGPPLARGSVAAPISTFGTTGLTVDEVLQLQVFVDEQILEYEAAKLRRDQQYVIAPHVDDHISNDGTVICHRYNCAGFVIEAYRTIDIDLLQTSPASLPSVALATLATQYPDVARLLENPKFREKFGIPGDGPWPVVLAGYVLNGLDRPEEDVRATPHRPSVGDEFFPSRRASARSETA
jgi:hypothetical protein